MEPTSLGGRGLGVRLWAVLVATALVLTLASLFAPPAKADSNVDEAQFFADLNAVRAKNGRPPLATDGQLINVARRWGAQLAGPGAIQVNRAQHPLGRPESGRSPSGRGWRRRSQRRGERGASHAGSERHPPERLGAGNLARRPSTRPRGGLDVAGDGRAQVRIAG